jgi:hypothetical protein
VALNPCQGGHGRGLGRRGRTGTAPVRFDPSPAACC